MHLTKREKQSLEQAIEIAIETCEAEMQGESAYGYKRRPKWFMKVDWKHSKRDIRTLANQIEKYKKLLSRIEI